MKVQGQSSKSKAKRRYGFLFGAGRKGKKLYQFKPVNQMTPEEIDHEIKLRFKSLQRSGKVACTDPASLEIVVPQVKAQPKPKPKVKLFKPTMFIKRR